MYRRKVYTRNRKSYGRKGSRRPAGGYSRKMVALPHLTKAVDLTIQNTATAPSASLINTSTTGTNLLLNAIQNGSGSTQRIGSKIRLAGVQLSLRVNTVRSSTVANEMWRILIVYDRQPNGQPPAWADVVGSRIYDASMTALIDNTTQPYNPDNRDRFMILYDKKVVPRATTMSAGPALPYSNIENDNQYMLINKFIKIPNLDAVYGNSSGPPVVGDIKSGSLFLMSIGNVAASSESQTLTGYIRTFFHDDPY